MKRDDRRLLGLERLESRSLLAAGPWGGIGPRHLAPGAGDYGVHPPRDFSREGALPPRSPWTWMVMTTWVDRHTGWGDLGGGWGLPPRGRPESGELGRLPPPPDAFPAAEGEAAPATPPLSPPGSPDTSDLGVGAGDGLVGNPRSNSGNDRVANSNDLALGGGTRGEEARASADLTRDTLTPTVGDTSLVPSGRGNSNLSGKDSTSPPLTGSRTDSAGETLSTQPRGEPSRDNFLGWGQLLESLATDSSWQAGLSTERNVPERNLSPGFDWLRSSGNDVAAGEPHREADIRTNVASNSDFWAAAEDSGISREEAWGEQEPGAGIPGERGTTTAGRILRDRRWSDQVDRWLADHESPHESSQNQSDAENGDRRGAAVNAAARELQAGGFVRLSVAMKPGDGGLARIEDRSAATTGSGSVPPQPVSLRAERGLHHSLGLWESVDAAAVDMAGLHPQPVSPAAGSSFPIATPAGNTAEENGSAGSETGDSPPVASAMFLPLAALGSILACARVATDSRYLSRMRKWLRRNRG